MPKAKKQTAKSVVAVPVSVPIIEAVDARTEENIGQIAEISTNQSEDAAMPFTASERARSEKSTTADLPAYLNCFVELKQDEYLFAQNGHNPVVLSSTSMQATGEATKENAPEAMESEPIEAQPSTINEEPMYDADDGVFNVEEILKEKTVKRKKEYLVRWENDWKTGASLKNTEVLAKYQAKMKKKISTRSQKKKAADADEKYAMESIEDERMEKGVQQYLVKWKNTWEPARFLKNNVVFIEYLSAKKQKR